MFTQSMPALAQALAGALPEAAIRQLMQSLGNCQQPLTHRGAVNLQSPLATGAGALARPGTWNPSDFSQLLPTAGQNVSVDIGGNNTTNNSHNYDGHNFSFPINQDFNYSDYFGGDTFNVAGNSTFDNSVHQTLKAGDTTVNRLNVNYVNNTYVGGEGRDGRDGFDGADGITTILFGGGGFGGGRFGRADSTKYVRDVTVRGNVNVPTVASAKVKDDAVDVTQNLVEKKLEVTGSVTVPTVESASVPEFVGTGTVTLNTVTGGTLAGATASGKIDYDTYPTATCGPLSATVALPTGGSLSGATASGTVAYTTYPTATCSAVTGTVGLPTSGTLSGATASGKIDYDTYPSAVCGPISGTVAIPTKGSFTATPTGIAAAATIGTLAGYVVVPTITGGYLDASCKLVLTSSNQTYGVTLSGAPAVTISSQGSVSGTVTLTDNTTTSLTIITPSITPTKVTASVTPTFNVAGGTVALTGSTTRSLTIATPSISMTSAAVSAAANLTVNGGTVSLTGTTSAPVTVVTPTISMTKVTASVTPTLTVNGGTFSPTAGTTTHAVTVTSKTVSVLLTSGSQTITVASTGSLTVNDPIEGKLRSTAVTLSPGTASRTLNLSAVTKPALLIYLRP